MQRHLFLVLFIFALTVIPSRSFSIAGGEAAPQFELSDLQGGKHSLSDYLGKEQCMQ